MIPVVPNPVRKQDVASVLATNLFVAFTFFSYGAAMMDYFLVYPSRAIVGADEFVIYHALLEDRILPISVVPFALMTILNLLLLWNRPTDVPKVLIWLSLICPVTGLGFFNSSADSNEPAAERRKGHGIDSKGYGHKLWPYFSGIRSGPGGLPNPESTNENFALNGVPQEGL
ncbi:hypothetical protein [Larkinella soli]|uniref:hypothetical protein n=1 Tax=Larkinella soli TaxID=1770527 RepID=UPI000FFBBB8E|nr:hypothetical protein [Larkinella soli]